MMPLTFAYQTITVLSKFDAIITTGLVLLIPVIIIESLIIRNYSKKSWWKLFKFCVITNFIASFAAILFFIFVNSSHKVILTLLCWVALLIIIIYVENIIYQEYWKAARKKKLLLALIIMNLTGYMIFTISISLIISSSVKGEYINRIRCTNNLKQIGLGLLMYADDYNGFLPDKSGAEGLDKLCVIFGNHKKYVYVCPSTTTEAGECKQKLTGKKLDYIYKSGLKYDDDKKNDYTKIPVVWDKPTNHENYGNVLFLDGHVKGFEGANWMEQAGIKKNTVSIVDRIKILPSQPKSIFETLHKKLIEKIKDPVLKKIVLKKSFKKWGKYEDEYISFSYPNHPKIKLEVEKNIKYKDSPVIAIYRLMIGNYRYFSLVLKKGVKFDDNLCLCGAVAFRKCLFVGRTLLRFNLLHNGYVKQVQALSEKYRVDVERWTHLKIQQPVYIKISSSIRFKEPGNLQKLKKKISAQYKGFCFLRIGMNRKQILKLLGEPAKKEGSKYFYDYPDGRYLNRYTIEFNNNGRFEGFKKGWEKTLLLKPVFGSVDWVREKVGLFCVKKPEDYYKSSYPGAIVEYKLAPFTAKDTKEIFDIFIKKLPNTDEDELFWLCDSVDKLAEHGYTDDRIIPYLSKECLTKIMPYSGIDIIVKYRPKNRNQLLIRQVELLYKYCDNPNCKRTYPLLFSTAIDNLLLHSPEKAHELVLSGMRHPNSEMRWRAYMFWTKLPANKVISLIRQGLKDKDSDIRSRCAVAFKSIGTKQDLKLLRDALKTEKDKEIKENLKKAIDGIQKGKKVSPKSMFYGE